MYEDYVFSPFVFNVFYSSSSSSDRLDNPPLKLLLSPQTSICVTSLAKPKALGSSAPEACQLLLVRNAWEVFLMILRECFPTIQMFRVTTPCGDKRRGLPCPGQQSPALSGCKILDTNLQLEEYVLSLYLTCKIWLE